MLGNYQNPKHYWTKIWGYQQGEPQTVLLSYRNKTYFSILYSDHSHTAATKSYVLCLTQIPLTWLGRVSVICWVQLPWSRLQFSCGWRVWMSVLQLEWAHAVVLCWTRAGESPAPPCTAPALGCSPYTALAALHTSHREPWAPATQLMDKQGDCSSCADLLCGLKLV